MQLKPIKNSDQWISTIFRGARAKYTDEQRSAERFIFLLIRTQYSHNWLTCLPVKGRKNKGNRLYKAAGTYFYSLNGPDRLALIDKYFDVNWEHPKMKSYHKAMMMNDADLEDF